MLDPSVVRRDVALCVKRVVVEETPFTNDTFHLGIVPSADPMEGFGAKPEAWAVLLQLIAACLRNNPNHPEYGFLRMGPRDAINTVSKPLSVAVSLIVARILAANEEIERLADLDDGDAK